ncbi:MAG: hypothetical protein ACI8XC_002422 [Gammaproteobacteria bacterium]|jgi:hypothetical protein
MAKVLFTWECGGGYGHLTRYRDLITNLQLQGHEAYFVVRNLQSAIKVYPNQDLRLLSAPLPLKNKKTHHRVMQPSSYLDVLVNQCFDDQESLEARIRVWLSIFKAINPQLIIFDHSPTALMAFKIFSSSQCIVVGDAFAVPPSKGKVYPFRENSNLAEGDLKKRDCELVEQFINPCLSSFNAPKLKSCMDIFDHPQRIFGIAELDHYRAAKRADMFIGAEKNNSTGKEVIWPKAEGPKVFIYSENHPHLRTLLNILSELRWPVIAVAKQSARQLMRQFQDERFYYSEELINIDKAAQECDFAINNSSMATCLNFLRNGKPMILLPAHIEQTMFAERLVENNCGINFNDLKTPKEIRQAVIQLGNPDESMHLAVKKFVSTIRSSLDKNSDTAMLEEVFSRLE